MFLENYFMPFSESSHCEENKVISLRWPTSIYEDDDFITIAAMVPGLSADEVDVTFEEGVLHIRGSKKQCTDEGNGICHREVIPCSFAYDVCVPGSLDEQKEPEAQLKNGVMRVSFYKQKQEGPKKIQIKCQ